jgi:hypothetical protein
MFQPYVLFKAHSYHSGFRERDQEGRAELATPQLGEASPSICKVIYRKNAPNGLKPNFSNDQKRRLTHGA